METQRDRYKNFFEKHREKACISWDGRGESSSFLT